MNIGSNSVERFFDLRQVRRWGKRLGSGNLTQRNIRRHSDEIRSRRWDLGVLKVRTPRERLHSDASKIFNSDFPTSAQASFMKSSSYVIALLAYIYTQGYTGATKLLTVLIRLRTLTFNVYKNRNDLRACIILQMKNGFISKNKLVHHRSV